MSRALLFGFILVIFMSCNNDKEETTKTSESIVTENDSAKKDAATKNKDISGCYLRVTGRDTLAASVSQDGTMVTGKLTFDNYQKDGSSGTISGSIDKDILKLTYHFQSEGMKSISEVYFRITGDGLIHGIGEISVKGDSAYYSDKDGISYPAKEILQKILCDKLPAKYQ